MNTFFTQFKKEAKKIRLSEREREAMLHVLERAMQGEQPVKSPIRITPSPLFFFAPRLVFSLAFVLVFAVVGSGTALAAEGAVPGDFLYPIKLNVNERIAAAVARSSEAKAKVHARFAERRIEEAQVLAARGTLTTDVKERIEENFEMHVAEVEAIVRVVEAGNPIAAADISARFSSSIEARSAVIARLGAEGEDDESRRESQDLSRSLRDRGRRLARADADPRPVMPAREQARPFDAAVQVERAPEVATLSATAPVDNAEAAVIAQMELTASTTLEEAEIYLVKLRGQIDATTSARTKAQISKIRAFIEKIHREAGEPEKQSIERALKDAATVKAFIEAQDKFHDRVLLPVPGVAESEEGRDVDD